MPMIIVNNEKVEPILFSSDKLYALLPIKCTDIVCSKGKIVCSEGVIQFSVKSYKFLYQVEFPFQVREIVHRQESNVGTTFAIYGEGMQILGWTTYFNHAVESFTNNVGFTNFLLFEYYCEEIIDTDVEVTEYDLCLNSMKNAYLYHSLKSGRNRTKEEVITTLSTIMVKNMIDKLHSLKTINSKISVEIMTFNIERFTKFLKDFSKCSDKERNALIDNIELIKP